MSENGDEKGFTVKDRRVFTEDGDVRPDSEQEEKKTQPDKGDERVPEDESPQEQRKAEAVQEETGPLPEINFASFVLSLHTSTLFHFGDLKDPVSGEQSRNLPAAKQTIDILGMLQEKTSGNLDEYEKTLIEESLFELRMRYLRETETK